LLADKIELRNLPLNTRTITKSATEFRQAWMQYSSDIKVQVNKQKPSDVCPAHMKNNSDKMPIAPTSQPCSKPNVQAAVV
jgi:hypothetical protein